MKKKFSREKCGNDAMLQIHKKVAESKYELNAKNSTALESVQCGAILRS